MDDGDWNVVRHIYHLGRINVVAMLSGRVPDQQTLDALWLPDHRWVAKVDSVVCGWAALAPAPEREAIGGAGEVFLGAAQHTLGRGATTTLMQKLIAAAGEAGLWMLQGHAFRESVFFTQLLNSMGFQTVGIRERFARIGGRWRDAVVLERRNDSPPRDKKD